MQDLGVCSGMAIVSYKSDANPDKGLQNLVQSVTGAWKGVVPSTAYADKGAIGACVFSSALGVQAPVANVLKFSAKLYSANTDCQFQTRSAKKQPQMGRVSWSLDYNDDGVAEAKMLGYLSIVGGDTATSKLLWVNGMVTKGEAAGATIGGNLWRMQVLKNPRAIGFYDAPSTVQVAAPDSSVDTGYTVAPGWVFSAAFENVYSNCPNPTPIIGNLANIQYMAVGALSTSYFGFGPTSLGFRFLM